MWRLLSVALIVLAAQVVIGCQQLDAVLQPSPEIVVAPGVISTQTADEVEKRMLEEIAANERRLGRALAPARIIKIQLLREGELFELRHFDGTNPGGAAMSPNEGPGWMVEAVGTFLAFDPRNPEAITAMGIHGFHRYDDAGGEGFGFNPCWTLHPAAPAELEGTCR